MIRRIRMIRMITITSNLWKKKTSPLVKHGSRPGDFQAGVSRATLLIHLMMMMIMMVMMMMMMIIMIMNAGWLSFANLGLWGFLLVVNFKWCIITWTEATLVGLRLVKQRVSPQVWPWSGYQCLVWVFDQLDGHFKMFLFTESLHIILALSVYVRYMCNN